MKLEETGEREEVFTVPAKRHVHTLQKKTLEIRDRLVDARWPWRGAGRCEVKTLATETGHISRVIVSIRIECARCTVAVKKASAVRTTKNNYLQ